MVLLSLTDQAESLLASLAAVHLAELRQSAPAMAALLERMAGRAG